jgi:hypothetical protein
MPTASMMTDTATPSSLSVRHLKVNLYDYIPKITLQKTSLLEKINAFSTGSETLSA